MDEISLSVDETNQLRLSLGLAPLVIEEAAAEQPKRQASPDQASRNERLIENIKRQKARAFTTSGSGLGSGTSESSLEFIKRLSSGNKGKTAPKMTAKDSKLSALAGLDSNVHISKAVVDNVDNVDTILVLKDQTLAENDSHGDTLTTLRANKVQNDVKQYNPYDEHSSLLEQYNEPALEETVVMTLGSRAEIAQTAQKEAPVKNAVSLDYDKSRIQKDYNPSLAFKPRKIKRKKTNFRAIVPDDELVAPGDYSNAGNQLARTNFVDDDDLQTAIAQSRRQYVAPLLMNLSSDDEAEGITLLDSNLLAVGSRVADVQHIEKTEEKISPNDMIIDHQQDQDVDMLVASVKQEPLDEPMTPDQPNMAEHAAIEPEILVSKTGGASGIGAALKLLMQHGDLKPANSTQVESQSTSSRRQEWAERQRAHTEKREMELRASKARNKALGGRATHVNRTEWDTKNDLLVEKQLKYRDYVPDVKLQYTDEKGRILTTKEAFKEQAHRFHGKKSGKNKKEKGLLKLAHEVASQRGVGLDELMAPLMKKSVKEEDTDGFARRAKVKVETAIVEHDKRPIKEESVNNEPVRDPGAAQDSAKRAKQSSGSGGFVPLPVEDSIAKPSTIEPNRPKIAFSFKKK